MSTAEYTITLHNTDNSASRSSAEKSAQTAQRELFRAFIEKYIIGIVVTFTMLITLIYSVYAATRIKYLPSAIILMVTMGIISYLLEKGDDNGNN